MKAMHGFAGPSRKRGRLIGCCTMVALMLSAVAFAVPAGAVEAPPVTTYLALGDSLAFGYTAVKKAENAPFGDSPTFYEEGYDNFYAKKVRLNKEIPNKGLVIVNLGCPGETSGGLLGSEPPTCGYQKAGLPLHDGYVGHSQIEAALGLLTQKNGVTSTTPAHPVSVISFNIGGNDELAAVAACEKEVGEEYGNTGKSQYGDTPEHAVAGCIAAHAPALFEKIVKHIVETMGAIDTTGKYSGPIVFQGFYNPDSFLLPGSDILTNILNQEAEKGIKENIPNAVYANPFPKINPQPKEGQEASPKTEAIEQAAICKYTEMCNPVAQAVHEAEAKKALPPNDGDIHPSKAGYELLAKLMYEKAPV
ncbi:MAG: hypothetical protein QOI03_891 [Solirubrobacteraceae bacterium]|jgi:lysophospholipase L1-like esterase|nr:hypothetical protein [Solirubrobacteraceae bacterium]